MDFIITIDNKKILIWPSKEEALLFYIECSITSEGSERQRYLTIIEQIKAGKKICSDNT